MNEKILITGGSGLLGAYLVRWFKQKGYTRITATFQSSLDTIPADIREGVKWKKLALPDKVTTMEILAEQDWVIHAAGLVSYRQKDKFRLLEINNTGTGHIVDACLTYNVSHLVYVGSIGALGRETDHVTLSESTPWLQNEFSTSYGLSKYLGELEVWRGMAEGLNASVILPSVILGTGDWHKSSLQIIDRIARKAPWYPGGQTGYVDVRDIVMFTDKLLVNALSGQRWILNGSNMPYKDLYEKFAFHLGINKTFRMVPKWLAGIILRSGNILKGRGLGVDVLNQIYGTFTYDGSKSLSVDGFTYRDLEETIIDIARIYRKEGSHQILSFIER